MAARKATDEQIIEALNGRTVTEAASILGLHPRRVAEHKARLAKIGIAPEHGLTVPAPEAFAMGKVTVQRNEKGEVTNTWARYSPDVEKQLEAMRAAVKAMSRELKPEQALAAPPVTLAHLLNCYVITDYHLGMNAWGEETGADWDMRIAEDLLVAWFSAAIAQSPDARIGVFAQLGDFLHWDGIQAVTLTSGHVLDADTRFQKLVRVAISVIRRVTSMLLQKHEKVILLMAEGNHDLASSMWLRELFAVLYAEEPRIEVVTRPDPYYCVEHGLTSLFFHHSHKKRMDGLETVFISKFREVFGRTKYSYAHTGHLHHNVTRETNTMQIEQHRTLAAPDSHASRGGWMSGREAKCITYHSEHGEVGRITVSADMLKGEAA